MKMNRRDMFRTLALAPFAGLKTKELKTLGHILPKIGTMVVADQPTTAAAAIKTLTLRMREANRKNG